MWTQTASAVFVKLPRATQQRKPAPSPTSLQRRFAVWLLTSAMLRRNVRAPPPIALPTRSRLQRRFAARLLTRATSRRSALGPLRPAQPISSRLLARAAELPLVPAISPKRAPGRAYPARPMFSSPPATSAARLRLSAMWTKSAAEALVLVQQTRMLRLQLSAERRQGPVIFRSTAPEQV